MNVDSIDNVAGVEANCDMGSGRETKRPLTSLQKKVYHWSTLYLRGNFRLSGLMTLLLPRTVSPDLNLFGSLKRMSIPDQKMPNN